VQEVTILQRERDQNAPAWLFTAGSIVVLFLSLMVIAGLTWGAGRINNSLSEPEPAEEKQPVPKAA
jgi:Na+-transporting methylmalonyl-CoA/oxaloacetate decarboxylase gamma subunit